jgi:hypothetical protein
MLSTHYPHVIHALATPLFIVYNIFKEEGIIIKIRYKQTQQKRGIHDERRDGKRTCRIFRRIPS